ERYTRYLKQPYSGSRFRKWDLISPGSRQLSDTDRQVWADPLGYPRGDNSMAGRDRIQGWWWDFLPRVERYESPERRRNRPPGTDCRVTGARSSSSTDSPWADSSDKTCSAVKPGRQKSKPRRLDWKAFAGPNHRRSEAVSETSAIPRLSLPLQ